MNSKNNLLKSKLNVLVTSGLALALCILLVSRPSAQFDDLNSPMPKIDDEIAKAETTTRAEIRETNKPDSTRAGGIGYQLQNVTGKLVFSAQPIDPANPTNLTDNFKSGDFIYGALLLNGPFKAFVQDQYVRDSSKGYSVTRPGFDIDFQIDGKQIYGGSTTIVFQLDKKEGAWNAVPIDNYFIFDIAPEAAKAKTYGYREIFFPQLSAVGRKTNKAKAGAQFYSFQLSKLSPGDHTVWVKIKGAEEISGEFKITGSSYTFYAEVADKLDSVAASNMTMPKSQWNNPAVKRTVTSAFKRVPGERVLRVVLISPSWFIQRNSLGQIIHRGLFAVVATKKTNGTCFVQKEYFKQYYRGRGRYGPTVQDGKSETRQMIPCEKIDM